MTDGAFTTDHRAHDILDVLDSLERSQAKFGVDLSGAENTKVALVNNVASRVSHIWFQWYWQIIGMVIIHLRFART